MRRRRHLLQVSTFPFLAVLLCTMGSLLMLLLIIDRRAKIAARNKALVQVAKLADEAAKLAEEQEKTTASRLAQLQSRQDALHAELEREHRDLLSQVEAVREKAQTAEANAETIHSHRRGLQQQLHAEIAALERAAQALSEERRQISVAKRQAASSQTALAKMTADLDSLEQTLVDLRAARKNQQQTYSLVPYKGKRGDNRRPLYVECTELGLVFHPDRKLVVDSANGGTRLREEVERRFAKQKESVKTTGLNTEQAPYLFLLVRPDGITSYYHLLAALHGVQMDFGYEFVESDWVFDFTDEKKAAASNTWQTADQSPRKSNSSQAPASPVRPGLGKPIVGLRPGDSLIGGRANVDSEKTDNIKGGRPIFGQRDLPGTPKFGSPLRLENGNSGPGYPDTKHGTLSGIPGFGSGPIPGKSPPSEARGSGLPGDSGGEADLFGKSQSGAERNSRSVTASRFPQGSSGPGATNGEKLTDSGPIGKYPEAGPQRSGEGVLPSFGGGSRNPSPPLAGGGAGEPGDALTDSKGETRRDTGNSDFPETNPRSGFNPASRFDADGSKIDDIGGSAKPDSHEPGDGLPRRSLRGSAKQPNSGSNVSEPASPGETGASGNSAMNRTGEGQPATGHPTNSVTNGGGNPGAGSIEEPEEGSSLAGTPPILGVSKSTKMPARLPRLTGNRDWIILVECNADGVSLPSANMTLSRADLAQDAKKVAGMLQAVQKVIERRQAAVRPGEPAFRPQLRFVVEAAGLRTYHLAYPILETLKLPMTRQDLEPPEESPRPAFPVR